MSKIARLNRLFDSNPFDMPLPECLSARVFYWTLLLACAVLLGYVFDKIEKKTNIHGWVAYVVEMTIIASIILVVSLVWKR